ncbi:MAG: imidazoleglycerol-phosphate dehydratase [Candidatus Omnitrophica bacterium]|nr:imidazoleglycerol-phosphate dehydratase [Candidatus Omnitrophota bacterium]MBU1997567.1 imidazoleglycerol-phosphate dehydratase [Candidatus Omnitrophota bacterium]MBU4333277.1 imidazoleglycerol-phosphate dehydratase [Candidatus Omnitrophota bacterium]
MDRKAQLERKSNETEIVAEVNVDGKGQTKINTNIGFLDHMLELFAFHGYFDLNIEVKKADLEIDIHHTNEDIGIVLGKLFKKALGENVNGIKRFGSAFAPMESTLARSVIDICGRPHLKLQTFSLELDNINNFSSIKDQENYSTKYLEHFLESFAKGLGATINVLIENPDEDLHTCVESVFKSLGLALDIATTIDPRRAGEVPSTKGIID